MNYRTLALTLTIALFITAFAAQNHVAGVSRVTEDLTDLVRMATVVAEVEVLEQKLESGKVASTLSSLKVIRVYKGDVKEGTILAAQTIGGFDGMTHTIAPGQAKLTTGKRYVLMLSKFKPDAAAWSVLGGDAGQIDLGGDAHGNRIARRPVDRFAYYVADTNIATGYRHVAAPAVSAECLDAVLTAIVKTGRPVLEKSTPAVEMAPIIETKTSAASAPALPASSTPWGRIALFGGLAFAAFMVVRKR